MNKYIKALIVLIILPITVVITSFSVQTLTLDEQVSAQQTNLQQRVELYKQRLQAQPSKSELNKLKLRCRVSQQRLKSIAEKSSNVQTKRNLAYGSINKSLEELLAVLKQKGINTSNLETQTKELKSKTDTFAVDMSAYKQALEDSSTSDCATDPLAVKASLEEARNYRVKLAQEIEDIRVYIANVLKISLKQAKADLEAQKATNTTNSGTTNSNPTDSSTGTTPSATNPATPATNNQSTGGTSTNATQ